MRTLTTPTIAVAGLVAAAVAGLVAYLLFSEESAGPETGVTLANVLEDPARYEGEHVSISGEWAENRYLAPDQAEDVIVLGDDAENPLLVVPRLGVDVPEMDENTVVAVEGIVRLPERTGAGVVAPDALMERPDGGVAPIFVSAPATELDALEAGDRVEVRAELSRLSAYGAHAVEQALQADSPVDQPPSRFDMDDVPIDRGEPYLLLRALEIR